MSINIYLCHNSLAPARLEAARHAVECFENRLRARVCMSASDSQALCGSDVYAGLPEQADLVVSVGGDGSVLRAAQVAVACDVPLLGINSGRLGYLCALELRELSALDEHFLSGLRRESRTMLSAAFNGSDHIALNDIVIARRRLAGTLSASVLRGTDELMHFRGDGLIVATPTGSTAYSRSAGGPVLLPDSGCFALTPICAHTAGTAPIVVPDSSEYCVRVTESGDDPADVLADGTTLGSLSGTLTIAKHPRALTLLRRGI